MVHKRGSVHRPVSTSQRSKRTMLYRYRAIIVGLEAFEREVVEKRLVDFAERRRGVCGLVHPRLQVCLG
jgi:hypothetical protein